MKYMVTTVETGIAKLRCKAWECGEKLKTAIVSKNDGDGHYVALALGILLAVVIGAIVFKAVSGDTGFINGIVTSVNKAVTDFITKLTNATT